MSLRFPPDEGVYIPHKDSILIAGEEPNRYPVLCYVTRGSMIAAGAAPMAQIADFLAFFEQHRKEFEAAVIAAYEAAPSHSVTLDVADILQFGGTLRP